MSVRMITAVVLLCAPMLAGADGLLQTPDGTIVSFKNTPCESAKVLAFIKPEYHSMFKMAGMLWQGKVYEACWAEPDPGVLAVVDETGEVSPVPRRAVQFDLEVNNLGVPI